MKILLKYAVSLIIWQIDINQSADNR
jgi:hypothetical protein